MAAATPGGGHPDGGDPGSGQPVPGMEGGHLGAHRLCPRSPRLGERSPKRSSAAAFARAVLASPAQTSHQWASCFGGVYLDDDIWDIWFNFPGQDNVEMFLCSSDITVKNLMAMVEEHGYGYCNTIYYVREKGKGFEGLEAVNNMVKVQQMLELFDRDKVLQLIVLKDGAPVPFGLNLSELDKEELEEQIQLNEQAKFAVDKDGVTFIREEESEAEEVAEGDFITEKKLPLRPGPTSRSHYEPEEEDDNFFVPTSDEECSHDELHDGDDDGYVKKIVLTSGMKRRLKKLKKRQYYDPTRADAHDQFAIKLCFKDVYEFRVALRNYHIAQLRNFRFHRNNSDRVIVQCTQEDCPFFISASNIAHERTFCIRKFHALHTCIAHGENTKVTIDWLAIQSEQAIRTNPKTSVDTLIDNAKLKFGVEVPRSKAYRARKKDFSAVIGDRKKQYARLRDYLQAILDTNPGSRCIITTKEVLDATSPNPRFHGLFICLNASKEGFLNGCRPFIGLDGCLIKLSTGQQILAATGRDGNNNIFPIAFGVVDKEDTASWLWFLTQLKYCIGESGKFGNYTIMSDRQKGLLKAISHVFPNSPGRYYLRHIFANFQRVGFKGTELKKHMFSASYAYTKSGFDKAMDALKTDCEAGYNWLMQIPVEAWARHAFDTNCKTDLVVNNLSEVFNRMILDVRNKPIQTMIDGIKDKLMVKYSGTRQKAENTRWEITPFYSEQLEIAKKFSRECKAKNAEIGL
ncbi:unnamed protein product [Alopecurus aequalis]